MSEANTEIGKLNHSVKNPETPDGLTMSIMKKYYWNSDFNTRRAFVEHPVLVCEFTDTDL